MVCDGTCCSTKLLPPLSIPREGRGLQVFFFIIKSLTTHYFFQTWPTIDSFHVMVINGFQKHLSVTIPPSTLPPTASHPPSVQP